MQTNAHKHELTLTFEEAKSCLSLSSWHALTTSAAAQIGLEQQQSKCGPSLLGSDMHTWSVGSHTNQAAQAALAFPFLFCFWDPFWLLHMHS